MRRHVQRLARGHAIFLGKPRANRLQRDERAHRGCGKATRTSRSTSGFVGFMMRGTGIDARIRALSLVSTKKNAVSPPSHPKATFVCECHRWPAIESAALGRSVSSAPAPSRRIAHRPLVLWQRICSFANDVRTRECRRNRSVHGGMLCDCGIAALCCVWCFRQTRVHVNLRCQRHLLQRRRCQCRLRPQSATCLTAITTPTTGASSSCGATPTLKSSSTPAGAIGCSSAIRSALICRPPWRQRYRSRSRVLDYQQKSFRRTSTTRVRAGWLRDRPWLPAGRRPASRFRRVMVRTGSTHPSPQALPDV